MLARAIGHMLQPHLFAKLFPVTRDTSAGGLLTIIDRSTRVGLANGSNSHFEFEPLTGTDRELEQPSERGAVQFHSRNR